MDRVGVAVWELRRLGYDTALFGDSDRAISPDAKKLVGQGVAVIQWNGKVSTEQRIAADLPFLDLQSLFEKACQIHNEARVLENCRAESKEQFDGKDMVSGPKLDAWKKAGASETSVRQLIGLVAREKAWFKDLNAGNALGKVVVNALPKIPKTDLAAKLKLVEQWVYG